MNTNVMASATPLWRSYAMEIRCEWLRMLREPAFAIPVLAFPAVFYLLFGVLLTRGNVDTAQYMLATYSVFGVIGAALFGFGVTIAVDRSQGYLQLRRALPTPPGAPLLAKSVTAMLFAAIISLLLMLLAIWLADVAMTPRQWALLLLVQVLGALPFCAIGLYIGTLVSGNAAPALLNLIYLPMAFLSGLWLPLSMLPDVFSKLAPLWPAYHLGQMALKVVGKDAADPWWIHLLVLSVIGAGCFWLAQRRLEARG